MRILVSAALSIFLCQTVHSQELVSNMLGLYSQPVYKSALNSAKTLKELTSIYPNLWIDQYTQVEISKVEGKQTNRAISSGPNLNSEQTQILKSANIGAEIIIYVDYRHQNPATSNFDERHMELSLTVVPENEAKYQGGTTEMNKFIKKNILDKIAVKERENLNECVVHFTVNEEGKVCGLDLIKSSGNISIDATIMTSLSQMPQWKSATDSKGQKTKQVFEFRMGKNTDGC